MSYLVRGARTYKSASKYSDLKYHNILEWFGSPLGSRIEVKRIKGT